MSLHQNFKLTLTYTVVDKLGRECWRDMPLSADLLTALVSDVSCPHIIHGKAHQLGLTHETSAGRGTGSEGTGDLLWGYPWVWLQPPHSFVLVLEPARWLVGEDK